MSTVCCSRDGLKISLVDSTVHDRTFHAAPASRALPREQRPPRHSARRLG